MAGKQRPLWGAALAMVLVMPAIGCGLVDPDVADFDIELPRKSLTVDTADWQLSGANLPAISCADNPGVCSVAIQDACSSDNCFGMCDGTNCQVRVLVSLWKEFNLREEQPSLQTVDDKALLTVSISRIGYEITENTFNVASPALTVYAAPATIMAGGSPQALEIGTIPPVGAGETVTEAEIEISQGGEAALRTFMEDFSTPFNIIIEGTVDLSAGDAIPVGLMSAAVRVTATAGLGR